MKKLFLLSIICGLIVNTVFSQINYKTITIKGKVTTLTDQPIAGHNVYVSSDSIPGIHFFHYRNVLTDNNGLYLDTINIPNNINFNRFAFNIWTYDCNNLFNNKTFYYINNQTDYIADFKICDDSDIKCKANFYGYRDSAINSSRYAYRFFDNSTGGTTFTLQWDFGDNTGSNEKNPLHKYDKPGNYNVCLKIITTNPNGITCEDKYCSTITITDYPPPPNCKAFFTFYTIIDSSTTPNLPKIFQFINQSKGNAQYYYWDFGDGTSSAEKNPQHIYMKTGYYYVCLAISDSTNAGCYDRYCDTIVTRPPDVNCKPDFFMWLDSTVNTPNLFHFIDISEGFHRSTYWEFGDGITSSERNPVHQYNKPGIYNVCLTIVNDSLNCRNTICKTLNIPGIPGSCRISFSYFPDSSVVSIPEQKVYKFIPASSGPVKEFLWDFGDGSKSREMSPSHGFYFYPGKVFHVCLTATIIQDSNICTAINCQNLIIDSITPPPTERCKSSFTYNIINSDTNFIVSFYAYTNNLQKLIYNWKFGDGKEINTSDNTITHAYLQPGIYNVCLTTTSTDSIPCTFTSCQLINNKRSDSTFYGSMSGQIFAGNNFADKGYVTIVQMDNTGGIIYYDVSQIEAEGKYHFDKIPFGGYYVKAKLYSSSHYYTKYVPTYYGDKLKWTESKMVGVGDFAATDHIDIHLIALKSNNKGTCHISGYINDYFFKSIKGAPISNTEVYLLDETDNPIMNNYTDSKGYYIFPNLDYGTYKIYVEVLGLVSVPISITLSPDANSADNVNFSIDNSKVSPSNFTSIQYSNIVFENKFSDIYPNPLDNVANIAYSLNKTIDTKINISNQLGQVIYSFDKKLISGNSILKINTSLFDRGIYVLKISGSDLNIIKRFVKIN